VDLTEF